MAHISLPEGVPGIIGPMLAYPAAAQHLNALAEYLLRGPSPLSPAERELIASCVSADNQTAFCEHSHAATARVLFGDDDHLVDVALRNPRDERLDPRLRALLNIAAKVRAGGSCVTQDDVLRARAAGADDQAIHDTVLIASAFCMFNRYVDGLGTWTPTDPHVYNAIGQRLATVGYVRAASDALVPGP